MGKIINTPNNEQISGIPEMMNGVNQMMMLMNQLNKKISNLEMRVQKHEWVFDILLFVIKEKVGDLTKEEIDILIDKYVNTMMNIEWETMDDEPKEKFFENDIEKFKNHEEFQEVKKMLKKSLEHSLNKVNNQVEGIIDEVKEYKEKMKKKMEELEKQQKLLIPEDSGKIITTK